MANIDPELQAIFGMKPQEIIKFLQDKGLAKTWNFDDMLAEAHNHTFTVAKAMRNDILADIHEAVVSVPRDGISRQSAKSALTKKLQAKGWWGKQDVVDTGTGEVKKIQLGSPRRLNTIFQTNLQSAYMNARMDMMRQSLDTHPYWQWVAVMDRRTRPSHAVMNGRVFGGDDVLWTNVAKPPCGYNCRCRPRPLSKRAVEREGLEIESSAGRMVDVEVNSNGQAYHVKGLKVTGHDGKPAIFKADVGFELQRTGGANWQAPFTPIPMSNVLPKNLATPKPLPLLPAPEVFDATRLFSSGMDAEHRVSSFLNEFGATLSQPVTFWDVTDEPLLINDALFKDKSGAWKVDKSNRAAYLPMLADAIKRPDEIWLYWQAVKSNVGAVLRRRYIKQFIMDGQTQPVYAAFDEGKNGWAGVTIFQVDKDYVQRHGYDTVDDYIQDQRRGYLLYSRTE
ncbi:MAG: minor capsid protein [Sulfuriferula sp.]|nr:minor capsid protein [Sulfuriferula sp.]